MDKNNFFDAVAVLTQFIEAVDADRAVEEFSQQENE